MNTFTPFEHDRAEKGGYAVYSQVRNDFHQSREGICNGEG